MAIEVNPGTFYLGREYDPDSKQVLVDKPVMYKSSHLTTHAVCVGMTGSGKTGLCIDLLEEAALNGLPAVIIDPKGDMGNLLLTFPALRPEDFEPWVNADDAQRAGMTQTQFAAKTAGDWAKGLAEWDQDSARIQKLRDAAEFAIFTPGSKAGLPVNVLRSFQAPELSWETEEESLRELISATVSALLGLIGVEADPIRSREHILLSNIIEHAWRQGEAVDMARLIGYIQQPPMKKLGVFDVDTFFPQKDRFGLAMQLNAVVAAPSFQTWMQGIPLDIAQIIRTPQGKPRIAIFSIAHLSDEERMFFVSLLLEQVIAWMRQLPGTTSLRTILYFDEVFGFFPPDRTPPSKAPLLTLMKTARAFGVGIVLATQNPIDLDYKGLTNAGTWFVGKLQTTYDKQRLLDGMEGVTSQSGTLLDRRYLDDMISSLPKRTFVLHNVNNPKPILMTTRWAMSYLCGPLTRSQVQMLMAPLQARSSAEAAGSGTTATQKAGATAGAPQPPPGYSRVQPQVNSRVSQYYLPVEINANTAMQSLAGKTGGLQILGAWMAYEPYLVAIATAVYTDSTRSQMQEQRTACLLPLQEAGSIINWNKGIIEGLTPESLREGPVGEAIYGAIPAGLADSPAYTQLRTAFTSYINRERFFPIWLNETLKMKSVPGEDRQAFLQRCEAEAAVRMEEEIGRVSATQSAKINRLEQKLQMKIDALEKLKVKLEGRRAEEGLGGLSTLVSIGGKLLSGSKGSIGRAISTGASAATSASRRRRMTSETKTDLENREDEIAALQEDLAQARAEADTLLQQIREKWQQAAAAISDGALRAAKSDIRLEALGLVWVPFWLIPLGDARGVNRYERINAFDNDWDG